MKISVIIPVYNKIKYLETLLNQLREQTLAEFECLLIDDGSTDGSQTICDNFAAQDARFRVTHIPNSGVSRARNVGLDQAAGDYITFIDSDDQIHPQYLENLYRCAEESQAELIISGYVKTGPNGEARQRVIPDQSGLIEFEKVLSNFATVQMQSGLYGCCVAKLFPRCLVENIRFDPSLRLAEDYDFYIKLYSKLQTVFFDNHALYYYLQEAENSTGNTASHEIEFAAQLRIWARCKKMLESRNAYTFENQTVVEERLDSYAFFALFHCDPKSFRCVFNEVMGICKDENIKLKGKKVLQKWLLFCLIQNMCFAAKVTMSCRYALRKLLQGGS